MLKECNYFWKIARSNFTRLDFPHKISYILTYRCNLRCRMCNIWKKEAVAELDLESIERFFRRSSRFSWIGITGGEPFLREDLPEVVRIIADNCKELVALHFATNGTLTDKITGDVAEMLKYCRGRVKLFFTLSIDGPADMHDAIRGVKGSWSRCMETFRRLRGIPGVQARIGITLSTANLGIFPDTFAAIKEAYPLLRFDDITVNVFQRSSFYYDNEQIPEPDRSDLKGTIDGILEMDRDAFTINNFLRRKYLGLYGNYVQSKKPPLKCQALSATCVLEPQGDIYPCGIYGLRIGNLRDYDYDLNKAWQDRRVKEASAKCSSGECPSCWSPCDAYSAIAGSLLKLKLWRS